MKTILLTILAFFLFSASLSYGQTVDSAGLMHPRHSTFNVVKPVDSANVVMQLFGVWKDTDNAGHIFTFTARVNELAKQDYYTEDGVIEQDKFSSTKSTNIQSIYYIRSEPKRYISRNDTTGTPYVIIFAPNASMTRRILSITDTYLELYDGLEEWPEVFKKVK